MTTNIPHPKRNLKLLVIGNSLLADLGRQASLMEALKKKGVEETDVVFSDSVSGVQGLKGDIILEDEFKLTEEMIKAMDKPAKFYAPMDKKPSHPFAKFFQKRIRN